MKYLKNFLVRFIMEEEGATAVEYAIMASLIAAVIVTAVSIMGSKVDNCFVQLNNKYP